MVTISPVNGKCHHQYYVSFHKAQVFIRIVETKMNNLYKYIRGENVDIFVVCVSHVDNLSSNVNTYSGFLFKMSTFFFKCQMAMIYASHFCTRAHKI